MTVRRWARTVTPRRGRGRAPRGSRDGRLDHRRRRSESKRSKRRRPRSRPGPPRRARTAARSRRGFIRYGHWIAGGVHARKGTGRASARRPRVGRGARTPARSASRIATIACSSLAPSAPSMTRWSHDSVTDMRWPTTIWPSLTTGSSRTRADREDAGLGRVDDRGELARCPNMPRFETRERRPVHLLGLELALAARARRGRAPRRAIWPMLFLSASRMTGVTRPSSIATATPMSTRRVAG